MFKKLHFLFLHFKHRSLNTDCLLSFFKCFLEKGVIQCHLRRRVKITATAL